MPSNVNESTAKISMDISELKAGITEANRLIKLANSEFKAASSGMDNWESSADGLSAKIRQLNTVMDAQQDKLDVLQEMHRRVAEEQGENSTEAQNLQIRINNQQAAINKTAAELRKYQTELEDVSTASEKTADAAREQDNAFSKLEGTISQQESKLSALKNEYMRVALEQGESSDEAQRLGREIQQLSGELNENKTKMKQAADAADSFDQSLGEVGDGAKSATGGFTVFKGALAGLAANAITAVAGGIRDLVGSLFELSEATEEYRSMMAKTEGSATSFGYSAEFAADKYAQFYQYLGDDQMSTNAITNLMGMKASTDTVSDAANAAIAVWSAYGDSIPIESLTESINESAQVAQVTGTLADAINWAARSNADWSAAMSGHSKAQAAFNKAIADGETAEDAFSAALAACSSTQERADLIAQTLNQTFGESKKVYDENAKSILDANKAELELKDTQAQLGAAVEPVNTAFTNLKNKALQGILPLVQSAAAGFTGFLSSLTSGTATINGVANQITTALFGVLNNIANSAPQMLTAGMTFLSNLSQGIVQGLPSFVQTALTIIQNFATNLAAQAPTIIQKGYEMLSNLVQGIVNSLPILISQVPQIITTFANIINQNFPTILAKGAQLLLQLIQGILSAIPTLIANIPQIIQAIVSVILAYNWLGLGKNIITFFANGIKGMVSTVASAAKNIFNSVVNALKSLPSNLLSLGKNAISSLGSAIRSGIGSIASAAQNIVSTVVSTISSIPGRLAGVGRNIVQGIWNGISGAAGWLMGKVKGFVNNIVDGFLSTLGIHSPSTVFAAAAKWIPAGIGVGVEKNAKLAVNAVKDLSKDLVKKAAAATSDIIPEGVKATLSQTVNGMRTKAAGAVSSIAGTVQQTRDIVFNQYNTSPKALSRLDIYRQTRSQLFTAKGALRYV